MRHGDQEGFEDIRYCDLCDADPDDPMTVDYFKYLYENGLTDEFDLLRDLCDCLANILTLTPIILAEVALSKEFRKNALLFGGQKTAGL
jgi:hypothetical protein